VPAGVRDGDREAWPSPVVAPALAAAAAVVDASPFSPSLLLPAMADRRDLVNEALIPLVRQAKANHTKTRGRDRGFALQTLQLFCSFVLPFILIENEVADRRGLSLRHDPHYVLVPSHERETRASTNQHTTRSNNREIVLN
jgi:hypothetical protein